MQKHESSCFEAEPLPLSDPCAALRRATRAVTHLYDLVLSPTGLKATQFVLLQAIYERGEVAQWRLASEYGLGDDTLSRRLAVLRKTGLIACRMGHERPGERLYRLSEAGVDKYRASLSSWLRAQERLYLVMGAEQWQSLLKMAENLVAEARQAETVRFANKAPQRAFATAASQGASTSQITS
jgi:DNA-binding MarR family transcriptional regulator